MTTQGYLQRHNRGRVTGYTLTRDGFHLLSEGRSRVHSKSPFTHSRDEWTLLSFSVPEDRRGSRRHLRNLLAWAGFGRIRDGLWLAPGSVDVEQILSGATDREYLLSVIDVFSARPQAPTEVPALVSRVWDLNATRSAHEYFLKRWETANAVEGDPLWQLTALLADWFQLLRADPGLPPEHLGSDWPAARSTATFRRLHSALDAPALDRLRENATSWAGVSFDSMPTSGHQAKMLGNRNS